LQRVAATSQGEKQGVKQSVRLSIRKSLLYPILGLFLGLGAPLGALLLRFFWVGGNPTEFLASEFQQHRFFYAYMAIGTVSFLALYAYLVGRRDDRLVTSLRRRTDELEKGLEELRRVQRELVEKERFAALGLLSASVVHEVSSPLDGALEVTSLLESSNAETSRQEMLPLLRSSLTKIERLIQRLRFLARTPVVEPKEEIDLSLLLREVLDEEASRCRKAGIVVRTSGLDKPVVLYANPEKLHQVFLNIVTNAIEAMPQGGTLSVHLRRASHQAEVEIRDSGVGIPKEHLEKLFTPFHTTKPTGMGLGLTLAASILREHHGTIEIQSEVHRGTFVQVTLPLSKP